MTCVATGYLIIQLLLAGWTPVEDQPGVFVRWARELEYTEKPYEDARIKIVDRLGCAQVIQLLSGATRS